MVTVKHLLEKKGGDVYSISSDASVFTALILMAEKRIGALLVIDNDELVGIISERDYVRKVASQDIPAWSVKIHEVMTQDVITIDIDSPIEDCMRLMTTNRIRHLPVMEDNELTTVISITDVVSALRPEGD